MPYPELIAYIQEQTQQGVAGEVLRQSLMEAGWHELDIENGLHDVAAGLAPLTDGSSLHEDVSQVRSMVAHLASRVRVIETRLTSAGALPMQGELPSGTLGPDHELPAPRRGSAFGKILGILTTLVLFGLLGLYAMAVVDTNALASLDQMIFAAVVGFGLLIIGYVAMRRHHPWLASLTTASAVAVWAMTAYVAWRVYHYMEWPTAAGVAVLLIVLSLVMGRWIDRLSK